VHEDGPGFVLSSNGVMAEYRSRPAPGMAAKWRHVGWGGGLELTVVVGDGK